MVLQFNMNVKLFRNWKQKRKRKMIKYLENKVNEENKDFFSFQKGRLFDNNN